MRTELCKGKRDYELGKKKNQGNKVLLDITTLKAQAIPLLCTGSSTAPRLYLAGRDCTGLCKYPATRGIST